MELTRPPPLGSVLAVQAMRDDVQEVAVKVLAASQFSGIAEGIQLQVLKKVCFTCSASPLQSSHHSPCMQSSLLNAVAPCILLLFSLNKGCASSLQALPRLDICEQHLHYPMWSGCALCGNVILSPSPTASLILVQI